MCLRAPEDRGDPGAPLGNWDQRFVSAGSLSVLHVEMNKAEFVFSVCGVLTDDWRLFLGNLRKRWPSWAPWREGECSHHRMEAPRVWLRGSSFFQRSCVLLSLQGLPGPQGANGFPGPKGPPVRRPFLTGSSCCCSQWSAARSFTSKRGTLTD